MNLRARRGLAVSLAALATAAGGSAAFPGYEWPLREPPALTSTFGEFRPNHFHGGIDLTTRGRVGVPVVAVADGDVERLRASGSGYGRAVYVRLDDGRTAVYAHLDDFAPRLRDALFSVQDSLGQYEVDFYPPTGTLRVRRGEVLGASGESGAGGPHFHFELRIGEEGLNPLIHGFAVRDTIPPTLRALELAPIDDQSQINGICAPATLWRARASGGAKRIVAHGRLQVGVRAHDRAPGRSNRLAVFGADLVVDGRVFASCRMDSISWLRTHEVDLAYPRWGGGESMSLLRPRGAEARLFDGGAVLDLDALGSGSHEIEVIVRDASGGTARASWPLLVDRPPDIGCAAAERVSAATVAVTALVADADGSVAGVSAAWAPCASEKWEVLGELVPVGEGAYGAAFRVPEGEGRVVLVARDDQGVSSVPSHLGLPVDAASTDTLRPAVEIEPSAGAVAVRVACGEDLLSPPRIAIAGGSRARRLSVRREGDSYRAVFMLRASDFPDPRLVVDAAGVSGRSATLVAPLAWTLLSERRPGRTEFEGGAVRVDVDSTSFFEDLPVSVRRLPRAPARGELTPVSDVFRFEPEGEPLDGGIVVAIRTEAAGDPRIGLYRQEGNRWVFAGAAVDSAGGALGARVRRLAAYSLFQDETPPMIYNVRPVPGSGVSSRPRLAARAIDAGSGIPAGGVAAYLDGRPAVAEYDSEARSIRVHLRRPLDPGPHEVRFEVRDRAGHEAAAVTRFTVSTPGGRSGR
jgi:hypothetical protein